MRTVPDWSIQVSWSISGIFATGAVWYFLSLKEYLNVFYAACGAIVFTILAITLHLKKDKLAIVPASEACEAAKSFRLAFAEASTQIGEVDAHFLMNKHKVRHDVAILEFRRHIPKEKLVEFDEAVKHFNAHREQLTPAALAVMHAIATGEPVDDTDTMNITKALHDLLKFAEA